MKLHCREFSARDCEWELIGATPDAVVERARRHCESMHGLEISGEEEAKLRRLIRDR